MKREDLEEVMIELASRQFTVTGGQHVFEFAWEIVDELEKMGGEVTRATLDTLNEDRLYLVLFFSYPKHHGRMVLTGDFEDNEMIHYHCFKSSSDPHDVHSNFIGDDVSMALFSDLDKKTAIKSFTGEIEIKMANV